VSINPGLISVVILAGIHLFANRLSVLGWVWRGKFLSFASGLSFAYIFIDLLPALEKGSSVLKRTFGDAVPYLDRHTYLIALVGVLVYYGVQLKEKSKKTNWLSICSYLLFNFFIGVSLSDTNNPEIQPLALFTLAMGMHYFVRDHLTGVSEKQGAIWALIAALFAGYAVGYFTKVPDSVAAIAIAFVAGGILLNVFRCELPKKKKGGYLWFVIGSISYATILLVLPY
jgi:hypothetical protein